jgi:hypothetical protein
MIIKSDKSNKTTKKTIFGISMGSFCSKITMGCNVFWCFWTLTVNFIFG